MNLYNFMKVNLLFIEIFIYVENSVKCIIHLYKAFYIILIAKNNNKI